MCPQCLWIESFVFTPVNVVFVLVNLSLLIVPAPGWVLAGTASAGLMGCGMTLLLHLAASGGRECRKETAA